MVGKDSPRGLFDETDLLRYRLDRLPIVKFDCLLHACVRLLASSGDWPQEKIGAMMILIQALTDVVR